MRPVDADALKEKISEAPVWTQLSVTEIIDDMPTAERERGKWEEREVFTVDFGNPIIDDWQSARCSACGKYHTTPYLYYFDNFNFCPNCGADMREKQK